MRPGSTGAAVAAWEALFVAQSTLARRFAAAPVWHGRTMQEYDVLYQLSKPGAERLRQCDLTSLLLISQPSLSRLIDRLVKEELVERRPDPDDRRGTILSLTATGLELQRRIGAGHARDVAAAMRERLSAEQIETLRALTEQLVAPAEQTGEDAS